MCTKQMFLLTQQAPFANSDNYFNLYYNFDDVVDKIVNRGSEEDRDIIRNSLEVNGKYEREQEDGLPVNHPYIVRKILYQPTAFILQKSYFGECDSDYNVFRTKMDAIKFVLDNDIPEIKQFARNFSDLSKDEIEHTVRKELINNNNFFGAPSYTIKKFVDKSRF